MFCCLVDVHVDFVHLELELSDFDFWCITFSGQKQRHCIICRPNIVLFYHLQGQQLLQHLVWMGKHLLLRSKLVLLVVLSVLESLEIGFHVNWVVNIAMNMFQWWSHCQNNWLPNWEMFKGLNWSSANTMGGMCTSTDVQCIFLALFFINLIHIFQM